MTLQEFRKVNIDTRLEVVVLNENDKYLDSAIVDYTKDKNIDYMLDLYALRANVRFVSVNHSSNTLNITVTVDTNHPLYKYSLIAERR